MRKESFFPSLIAGMVQTGEESGKLGDILLQIASQKIEELKATSYEKILESMPFPKEEADNLLSGNTITTQIEDLGGYLEATVTVSWQDNSPHKVSLVTLIAPR